MTKSMVRTGSSLIRQAEASLEHVIQALAPKADAISVREPLIDYEFPKTSDLDLVALGQVNELLPQRFFLKPSSYLVPMVDIIWLPARSLDDLESFACNGLVPHRLLGSRIVYDKTGYVMQRYEKLRRIMYRPEIQMKRISGFLDMGFLTVREIGVTWDFPAVALFWLHMAHTACLAAMCDAAKKLCPNVYTRPLEYIRYLEEESNNSLESPFIEALHLNDDPYSLIVPLQRIHQVVSAQSSEPDWPSNMRESTRHEYRYFISREELEWRIRVAEEMADQNATVSAVFFLRFWAYVLARIPMVYQRAKEGTDVSFVRPARAVLPELEAHCPEIIPDLTRILGGQLNISNEEVIGSLNMLYLFRDKTLAFISSKGVELPELRGWKPFEPVSSE